MDGISQAGDVIIGVILPLHLDIVYHHNTFTQRPPHTVCTKFSLESYQQLQSVIFAIEEINNNHELLPNLTLGFQAYDSCIAVQNSLAGMSQMITGQSKAIPNYRCLADIPLSSVIAHSSSTHSVLMAHILGILRYPQAAGSVHTGTSLLVKTGCLLEIAKLPDEMKQTAFFDIKKTVPSDVFQSKALAQLILHFGWTWIGLLAVESDYGQEGIQLVRKEIVKAGACVAFTETIITRRPDRNAPLIVNILKQSSARVVVVFCKDIDLFPILMEMVKQDVAQLIFVASEALATSTFFEGMSASLVMGMIGVALNSGTIPGLQNFLNKVHPSMPLGGKWAKILWELTFNCEFLKENITSSMTSSVKQCTGAEDLKSVTNRYTNIIAKALEDLKYYQIKGLHQTVADIFKFKPWQ
ncbi:unnamed protein product, partial [Ranitomeya imitator]